MNWLRRSIFLMCVLLVAPVIFAQLTGTVNFTATKQQIDGFGVAATFGGPWFIQSATGNASKPDRGPALQSGYGIRHQHVAVGHR